MNRIEAIQNQIRDVHRERLGAERALAELSLKLVESPAEKSLQQELGELEREIEEHRRKVTRLQSAKAEAERLNTAEVQQKELEGLKKMRDDIKARLERQEALAVELITRLEALAPICAEYLAIGEDSRVASWSIMRGTCSGDFNAAQRYADQVTDAVRGDAIIPSLINGLSASMLTAFRLAPYVDIRPVEAKPLREELARAKERALSTLERLIAKRERELAEETAKRERERTEKGAANA